MTISMGVAGPLRCMDRTGSSIYHLFFSARGKQARGQAERRDGLAGFVLYAFYQASEFPISGRIISWHGNRNTVSRGYCSYFKVKTLLVALCLNLLACWLLTDRTAS